MPLVWVTGNTDPPDPVPAGWLHRFIDGRKPIAEVADAILAAAGRPRPT
ncbi:hypothetical protein AB0F15_07510 [Amycolatopsis sp. NPDC026612]